jgi:hypothetical protein
MFQMDVAKVDRDVTYVSMVVHVCCKCPLPMFHLYFRTYVASVFIWMLYMFHAYVACILSGCCLCLQMFSSVFRCFFKCLRSMLQVCVSNVSVVLDICCKCFIWMLHILSWPHICYSKSSILQVFHEAQVVPRAQVAPTERVSVGRRSRTSRYKCVAWRRRVAGRGQATTGRSKQQGGHACSDARPCVVATRGSTWETATQRGTHRTGSSAGALSFSASPF